MMIQHESEVTKHMANPAESSEQFYLSWNPATTEVSQLINDEIVSAKRQDEMGVYPGGGFESYEQARQYYRGYIAGLDKALSIFHGQMGVIVKRRNE